MTALCLACREGTHAQPDRGSAPRDHREALARMLAAREDLEECIAIVEAEIATETKP